MVWGRSEVGPKHKEKPGSVLPLINTIFPQPSPWNPECYQSLETQLHAKWRAVQTKGVWRWARRGGQIELERPHCPGWGVDVRGWRAAAAEAGRWCCASVSGAVWWTRAAVTCSEHTFTSRSVFRGTSRTSQDTSTTRDVTAQHTDTGKWAR